MMKTYFAAGNLQETLNRARSKQFFNRYRLFIAFVTALSAVNWTNNAQAAAEKTAAHSDQTSLAISLYQSNLALIKDTRSLTLDNGRTRLVWQDIASGIRSETAWLRHLKHPGHFQVLSQHFDLKRLTPQNLLESHIGETITVIRAHPVTGEETREPATLLSTDGGVVLRFADRIETDIPGRIAYPAIPPNLHDKPAMHILLNTASGSHSRHDLELTYLTHGLSWQADYILELDSDERHASLTGFAALTNQSGIDFHQAKTQLIAGEINQIDPARAPAAKRFGREVETLSAATYADMATEPHFELHRYILPEKITLRDNQTVQVSFLSARGVPVKKQFIMEGQSHYYSSHYQSSTQKQAVDSYVSFNNTGTGLGIPLPGGIVRAYQADPQGDIHFIGEDRMNHTANNATAQLKLGQAFDVSAEKKQTDFKKIPSPDQTTRQFETAHQIILSNAKKETVTVIVREPVPGDWHMLSASLPHQKVASHLAEWQIEIPAESQTILTYRVRTAL
ncbi:MAG: DUF4139 domain-containing protein [Nitrosomonas sp.]|nr:DUF4139 domain-containing protein [Nitrosomonas sp.]